jgi:hypothetical protein
MKRVTSLFLALICCISMTFAQTKTEVVKNETKTKKTSTLPQKVHNMFSKKKKYSGTKTKHVVKVAKVKTN